MFVNVLFFVIIMLVMLVPGFILRKVNLIKQGTAGSFSALLLYVCSPLLIFKSLFYKQENFPNPTDSSLILGMVITALLAFVSIIIVFLFAKIFFKKCKDFSASNAYVFASVFGNVAFIGIPFIQYILKGSSILHIALLYSAVFNVVFNILCWTLGVYIITGSLKSLSLKKIFLNPVLIVTVIALPLFFLKFSVERYIQPLADVINFLGSMTTPLSMIIVGIRLAEFKIKEVFVDGWVYLGSAFRLLLAPLIAFTLAMIFKNMRFGFLTDAFYQDYGKTICMVIMVLAALPCAASTIAFCQQFNGDSKAAVKVFMNSTLFALITLPLLIPIMFSFL